MHKLQVDIYINTFAKNWLDSVFKPDNSTNSVTTITKNIVTFAVNIVRKLLHTPTKAKPGLE